MVNLATDFRSLLSQKHKLGAMEVSRKSSRAVVQRSNSYSILFNLFQALSWMSLPSNPRTLPVLHARLVRHAFLQGQAIHLEEVFHVLDLSCHPLLLEPLELGLVRLPLGLAEPLVRMVAANAAPDALAVGHGQHPASAAAATAALPHATTWFGNL